MLNFDACINGGKKKKKASVDNFISKRQHENDYGPAT